MCYEIIKPIKMQAAKIYYIHKRTSATEFFRLYMYNIENSHQFQS